VGQVSQLKTFTLVAIRLMVASVVASVSIAVHGEPPSFDCNRASTVTEKAICADADLSDLDGRLGQAFSDAIAVANDDQTKRLRADQRAWIGNRDKFCAGDTSCLKGAIQRRTTELKVRPLVLTQDTSGQQDKPVAVTRTDIKVERQPSTSQTSAIQGQDAPASSTVGEHTALCKDGTYYDVATHQGACRGHRGVQQWLDEGRKKDDVASIIAAREAHARDAGYVDGWRQTEKCAPLEAQYDALKREYDADPHNINLRQKVGYFRAGAVLEGCAYNGAGN